jgi:hypothetical protein
VEPVKAKGKLAVGRKFHLEECPRVGNFIFKFKFDVDGMGDIAGKVSVNFKGFRRDL